MTAVSLRPSTPSDLAFITALERHPDHRDSIGQWTDAQHLGAMAGENGRRHSIIEREGKPVGYVIEFDRREEVGGLYVKRILVGEKNRGTGTAALRVLIDRAFGQLRTEFVWLLVRDRNARAQAVYRKLGFVRFDPDEEAARRFDAASDTPGDSFRMILRKG